MDHFSYSYGFNFDYISNDDQVILATRPSDQGQDALERSVLEKLAGALEGPRANREGTDANAWQSRARKRRDRRQNDRQGAGQLGEGEGGLGKGGETVEGRRVQRL